MTRRRRRRRRTSDANRGPARGPRRCDRKSTGPGWAVSSTGRTGDSGASESMLVVISIGEFGPEEVLVRRQQVLSALQHLSRQRDQLVTQPARGAVGELAAAMRRADRHDAADRRAGVEKVGVGERPRHVVIGLQLRERMFARGLPERVAAVDRLHLRDQSAHAVADEHHLIERRVTAARDRACGASWPGLRASACR